MLNLPDIDRQTVAGATATGTHGTGINFKSLSGYITGLRIITASGEVKEIDASHGDLFDAARVNLGSARNSDTNKDAKQKVFQTEERNGLLPLKNFFKILIR